MTPSTERMKTKICRVARFELTGAANQARERRGGGCGQRLRAAAGPHEEAVRSANLAIKFGLELGALASFAYWAARSPGPLCRRSSPFQLPWR